MYKKTKINKAVALAISAGAIAAPQGSTAQAQESDQLAIEEIIVTSTRRETTLQDTAVAVSVIGETEIAALNIDSFPRLP